METWLAIASRRETREYEERPLPREVETRILDAGRVAGSAANRQPWRFVVVESTERREALAGAVYAAGNVRAAALVVAIAVSGKGPLAFDAGRAAQNMLLAAWDLRVGGSPNGMPDADEAARILALEEGERAAIVLTFGYQAHPRDPGRRTPEDWSAKRDRRPLEELVRRI